jgi:hypothetical protein
MSPHFLSLHSHFFPLSSSHSSSYPPTLFTPTHFSLLLTPHSYSLLTPTHSYSLLTTTREVDAIISTNQKTWERSTDTGSMNEVRTRPHAHYSSTYMSYQSLIHCYSSSCFTLITFYFHFFIIITYFLTDFLLFLFFLVSWLLHCFSLLFHFQTYILSYYTNSINVYCF